MTYGPGASVEELETVGRCDPWTYALVSRAQPRRVPARGVHHERADVRGKRESGSSNCLGTGASVGEERFAYEKGEVVGHQAFELFGIREALVRHFVAGTNAIEHLVQPCLALRCRALDVNEFRLHAGQ